MKHLVFVYGSLRKGMGNHPYYLEHPDVEFVENNATYPIYTMISYGGFPAVSPMGSTSIKGEIYAVPDEVLEDLDVLEGHPAWYERREIVFPNETVAWMYIMPKERLRNTGAIVNDGDWVKYRGEML